METLAARARTIEELYAGARRAWPFVDLDREVFARYLEARLAEGETLEGAPLREHAADLYLACGCAQGSAAALREFESAFLSCVGQYVSAIDASPAFADEVRQWLRTKLFTTADGGRGQILDYAGRGALGGWLRVAAVRRALSLRRDAQGELGRDEEFADEAFAALSNPELRYIQGLYRDQVQRAFQAAFLALPSRDRMLLRLHYLDGLNLEAVAGLYHVGRSTAHRWITSARAEVLSSTLTTLERELHLSGAELESLLSLVRSKLHSP
jgi:RNA polymerase sigma-70 factor (ECF subfamily)